MRRAWAGVVILAGTLAVIPAPPTPAQTASNPALALWYDEPAADWETQSLPIGNGALGTSVFGGIQTERLQYNEKTLWTGGPGDAAYNNGNWSAPRPTAIDEVQAQIDRELRVAPTIVAGRLGGPRAGYGGYQNFGDAYLDMTGTPAAVGRAATPPAPRRTAPAHSPATDATSRTAPTARSTTRSAPQAPPAPTASSVTRCPTSSRTATYHRPAHPAAAGRNAPPKAVPARHSAVNRSPTAHTAPSTTPPRPATCPAPTRRSAIP